MIVPVVVIAAGGFAREVAQDVRSIYLRGDARREQLTRFLTVVSTEEEESAKLIPLSGASVGEGKDEQSAESNREERRRWFEQTAAQSKEWKAYLLSVLHQIRTHEQLLRAGWESTYDVPANLLLLADGKDANCAAIFPLLAAVRAVLAEDLSCRAWVLLNIAVFPEGRTEQVEEQQSQVLALLRELDELQEVKSRRREKLAKITGLPDSAAGYRESIYLFDYRKEGAAFAKDQTDMQVMVGNALLVLLEENVARRLIGSFAAEESLETRGFYASIGASAAVYDPSALQKKCALRLARSFFEQQLGCQPTDSQPARQVVERGWKQAGGLLTWLESLAASVPPECGQTHPTEKGLSFHLPILPFDPLDFHRLPALAWDRQLIEAQQKIHAQLLPLAQERLRIAGERLGQQAVEQVAGWADGLPLQSDLYPGGVWAATQAVELFCEEIRREEAEIEQYIEQIRRTGGEIEEQIQRSADQIRGLVQKFPKLPWWIRFLPDRLRDWCVPMYVLKRYRRQIQAVSDLQKSSLALMEAEYSDSLQMETFQILMEQVLDPMMVVLHDAKTDLHTLQETFQQGQDRAVQAEQDGNLFSQREGDLFRRCVGGLSLAEWGYNQWLPEGDAWIKYLLSQEWMKDCWKMLKADRLFDWVLDEAVRAYLPFWKLNIAQVMEMDGKLSGDGERRPILAEEFLRQGRMVSSPLLRPDFDASGGNRGSRLTAYTLLAGEEWKKIRIANKPYDWEDLESGNPYLALLFQVRSAVPLNCFEAGFAEGRRKLTQGEESVLRPYELISEENRIIPNVPPAIGESVKHFAWKFKPRGVHAELPQSIDLTIQRMRYEHYRRLPRLNGQWNGYAEEEMPEVRDLALAFQHLHAAHEWSTYTQVSNVLCFVQNCIPYSSDLATTGHEDWPRYPIETLMEETGDCEDLAVLCAAIIARLGFQVVLLFYPQHLAFGVAGADHLKGDYVQDSSGGKRYFYGEATAQGWHLGEIPKEYANVTPLGIYPVTLLIDEK